MGPEIRVAPKRSQKTQAIKENFVTVYQILDEARFPPCDQTASWSLLASDLDALSIPGHSIAAVRALKSSV